MTNHETHPPSIMNSHLTDRLEQACRWLTDIAMVTSEDQIGAASRKRHHHDTWVGAVRGEYRVATREWAFFCPVWHTGQAIKGLVMASDILGDRFLEPARTMAAFLLSQQVKAGVDAGLMLAYEDFPGLVNTSAQLECADGLWHLSDKTGDETYRNAVLNMLDWIARKAFIVDEGLFRDLYDPVQKQFIYDKHAGTGRPLLDDGIYLKAYEHTGNNLYRDVAVRTGNRLLKDEYPPGNWLRYSPCIRQNGSIHPRHAYWWGKPMLDLWNVTGNADYLFLFQRAVDWYKQAIRTDGGLFRDTRVDFSTASFGHATSATAGASILFLDSLRQNNDQSLLPFIRRTLDYCLSMQFTNPDDPNLHGAILEKVLPPDGTDRSPYHVRDLATIFGIQTLSSYLAVNGGVGHLE